MILHYIFINRLWNNIMYSAKKSSSLATNGHSKPKDYFNRDETKKISDFFGSNSVPAFKNLVTTLNSNKNIEESNGVEEFSTFNKKLIKDLNIRVKTIIILVGKEISLYNLELEIIS